VVPLAQALREAGREVEFATGPGLGLDAIEAHGFLVHRLPISRNLLTARTLHAVGALRSLTRAGGFDVVHAHTPAAAAVTRSAVRRLSTRVLYTMHGSFWGAGVPAWQRVLFSLMERRLGRWTDFVLTVNREDATDCVGRAGLPEESVRVLPCGGAGVAPEFFLSDEERDGLRRMTRERLVSTLARAFKRIAGEEKRAWLLMVGGALERERAAYSRERFLGEVGEAATSRVVWLGFQEHVPPFLAAADLVVLPSHREGFGMSLAEAAAAGRPVVATETRGARAVVVPGETGSLVPVGDAEALANETLRLVGDRAEAARQGLAARRRADQHFTRERVLAAYLEVYETMDVAAAAPAGAR
jgi:glycosyltransferase involved in cell wall biosynthesis